MMFCLVVITFFSWFPVVVVINSDLFKKAFRPKKRLAVACGVWLLFVAIAVTTTIVMYHAAWVDYTRRL